MTSVLSYNGTSLNELFADEKQGWSGYVEWEKYPDKKAIAREILKAHQFAPIPEFQFIPAPNTKPVLVGHRWKEYHEALGLKSIVDSSWETVQMEKPNLVHLLDFPFNGETRRDQLLQDEITDNGLHFVRNHGGIPDINEDLFRLEIDGLVQNPVSLSLEDLKDPEKFSQSEVTVTLQCSGTRRVEQTQKYSGDRDELIDAPWGEGAIGTAVYRGVPLRKVLEKACGGVLPGCQHLEFIGADTYFKKDDVFNYAVSVPYQKVRANEEVLLAWEMNGKPLPKIHGAPLRLVVSGCVGSCSCKWVHRINALAEARLGPDPAQEDLFNTSQVGEQNSEYANGLSIEQTPVTSAIISPLDKSIVTHDGSIELEGWAYGGNSHWVEKVEVSPDGGHVWYAVDQDDMSEKHCHAWRLWKVKLPVDAEGWLEFCVRAWDSLNGTEPDDSAWSGDDHVTSSYHRIKLYSVNRANAETRKRLEESAAGGEGTGLVQAAGACS